MNMNTYENSILPFSNITEIPVTYFDNHGQIQWECGSGKKICKFFPTYQDQQSICRKTLLSSTRTAAQLGEPYIFLCPSGFVKIAMTFIINGKMRGSFIAGPIAMAKNKENIIRTLFKNATPSPDIYPKLAVFLNEMKIYSPTDVAYLASLFNNTILASIINNDDYRKINENYKEQASAGERIRKYKKQNRQLDYPHELESDLIQKVRNGDVNGAQKTLTKLLNEIFLLESGNLSYIRIQVLGICAILSRISSKQDESFQISPQELENMDLLNKAESFNDLCVLTAKICENFALNSTDQRYSGNSSLVSKATQYINENYMNKITLLSVAEQLHTNHSYLSTLFKKETGISFTEYLNEVRLKRTQDLLLSTNLSLVEIALCSGFESQSYFTKVFKKKYGTTPREYRKLNQSHNM
jgi:two-component system response regulator YesN